MPKQTLISLLTHRAQETAESVAYTYQKESCSYALLQQRIHQFAAYLQQQQLERYGRVLILLPNGHDFFAAFYGTQQAGGIAVPIFPSDNPAHVLTMAQLCAANIIVLPSTTSAAQLAQFQTQTASLGLTPITVAQSVGAKAIAPFPNIQPDDLAFLQYTSGSTGNPKGVQLSHRHLLTNVQQMIAGMEITPDEIFVSWLPIYHDMGLILKTIVPFYLGAQTHLLPTSLNKIENWVQAIQEHKATFTAAPDFAYRLLVRHIPNPEAYDLSSLRVALNAAEPVRANTIADFEKTFGLQRVMVAGYGLAEATVGVSMGKPNRAVSVDKRGFVSVGRPFPDVTLTILQNNHPLPTGQIGDIAIRSSANTTGYFNNKAATEKLYWVDEQMGSGKGEEVSTILSGDLGYVDETGQLFIVGRKKNMIIQAGKTIYAAEIEEVVNAVAPVRYSAAIGIDEQRMAGEMVTIFAEIGNTHTASEAMFREIIIAISQQFQQRFGFRPGDIYLLQPKTIPMTYNGKLQHQKLQDLFLSGELRQNGRILFPDY